MMARTKLKDNVTSPVRWILLLFIFLCTLSFITFVNSQLIDEDVADELFPLPDYVDPDPEDPNDATRCTYQQKAYEHTARWIVDECSRCFCNNGTTNCVYETCPTLTCDFFEQVKIEGECCKKCPPELTVSRVETVLYNEELIIEGQRQELNFDVGVEIQKQKTSRFVHGENLWTLEAWISRNFDGSGNRLFYNENVLSKEQRDSSFAKPDYPPWVFSDLTLVLEGDKEGLCADFTYLCVKFNEDDNSVTQFNLDFSFSAQNYDDTRLLACTALPNCKSVVISDFDWSIEESSANRRQSSVNLEIDFREDTRDLEGSGLWQASLFATSNIEGVGPRYGEIVQILNEGQSSRPIENAEQIRIRRILTDFDLGTIGCTPDTTHLCLELQKGPTTQPDYTLNFLGEDGDISNAESVTKCVPMKCGAKAIFSELLPEISSPTFLIENTPAQPVVMDVDAITDKDLSTLVEGSNLWQMNVFFSKKSSGFGRRIGERFQVLDFSRQMETLEQGEDLLFRDVRFEVDLRRLVCEDIPYMCIELKKNPSSSIDYEFGTNPEQDPFLGCLDMSDICRGVIAKDLEWQAEFPNFLNGDGIEPVQPIISNASVDVDSISRDIGGRNLWQMSVFASSTDEAAPEDILPPYFAQVLTEEQAGFPVPEDGILRFYNMETPPFHVDRMGCGKYKYLCYEFKKAEDADVDFTFNEDTGDDTVLNCEDMECQAVTPVNLTWTLEATDVQPGTKTPVNLDVNAFFSDDTIDISGNDLWRLSLFGSSSRKGSGPRFDEVYQVLDADKIALPIVDGGPIEFGELTADFDIGTIGCTEDFEYVCVELSKSDVPDPDYIMLIEEDGDFNGDSIVSCKKQECYSKVVFDDLTATFEDVDVILEGSPDQEVRVHLTGVTNKPKTTVVSGESLWTMSTFFSSSKQGRGLRIMEEEQILDTREMSQTLTRDADLEFPDVDYTLDLSDVRCSSIPFVCFELKKNKQTSINYSFKPDPDREPLIDCQTTRDLCKGVVARFLSWNPAEDTDGHVPGELSPIKGDVTVDVTPFSRDLSGRNLWQLSVFASEDPDGERKFGPSFDQVLSKSQARKALRDGGPLTFQNVITPPYPIDQLGCGKTKYLCFDLRKSEDPNPDFAFETTEGEEVLRQCIEQSCEAVYLNDLSWEMEYDNPIPGQASPVDLDISATFDNQSKVVDGEDLWQVDVFGSINPDGEGVRFSRDMQVLTDLQSSMPIDETFSLLFEDTEASIDIGSIGCTDFKYVCIELKKAPNPTTDFHFIVPSEGDALPKTSAISCKPKECDARVVFDELIPEIIEPEIFTESRGIRRADVNLTAITDKDRTTQVAGENLWQANTFFSRQADGSGERLLETSQILDSGQASRTLLEGDDWMAESIPLDIDLSDVTCDQIPYMCFELIKNPQSSINYQSGGDIMECIDFSSRCKGVVFTDLEFEVTMTDDIFKRQPLTIDAAVNAEPYSRPVSGEDLWRVEVFSSPAADGQERTETFAQRVLGNTLPAGGPLSLRNMMTDELDPMLLGCADHKYLCVEFSKGPGQQPVYTFEVASDRDSSSLRTCKEQDCQGTILKIS